MVVGRLTFVGKDDGLAAGVAHSGGSRAAWDVEGEREERSDGGVGIMDIVVGENAGFRS